MLKLLQKKKIDATDGALLPTIIAYSIPLILSTIIQTLFSAVDKVVLGQMADTVAVAAVGTTSVVINLIVTIFSGMSGGVKILIAHAIGAGDRERIRKTAATSLITALCFGVIVVILGWILSPTFLSLTKCPAECYDGALLYIRIYLSAAPALLIYNFGAGILRASGDSQRPLYYILAGGILNVVLNVILCLILPQKVAAVAIATVASQILGAVLTLRRLFLQEHACKLTLREMKWDLPTFGKIIRYGFPIALSTAIFPLSNLQITSAVNSYGASVMAGHSAALTIETILSAFSTSGFGNCAATFMAQNLGAKKYDRVKQTFLWCLLLGSASAIVLGTLFYHTGGFWLGLMVPGDEEAIRHGLIRMFYMTQFYFLAAIGNIITNGLHAYGKTTFCTVQSLLCICGFRVLWMWFVYPYHQTFHWLMACYVISKFLVLVSGGIYFAVCYRKMKMGKLKEL